MYDITLNPSTASGMITIPASKSQTIRALLIATFANGRSIIRNPLHSQDTESCMKACKSLGASIEQVDANTLILDSTNVIRSTTVPCTIDCGNSGTTLYLACGMVASLKRPVTFTGDEQLCSRPVGPLLDALEDLGVCVTYAGDKKGYPPFTIEGPIRGGETSIECPTSQYLSGLLLACAMAEDTCIIDVPLLYEKPYVSITLSWLHRQGITHGGSRDMQHYVIPGNQHFVPFDEQIAGDFSSASFFFCAAAVCGSSITVDGLDPDDPQGDKQILSILQEMGCTVQWNGHSVTVTGPENGELLGGTFDLNPIPDALPVLAAISCFSKQTITLSNVPQARIKETDRIAVMCRLLRLLGAQITELEDGMVIHGHGFLLGGTVEGFGDHRVIMSLAIASLRCNKPLTILGIDAVEVTFPTFFELLASIT